MALVCSSLRSSCLAHNKGMAYYEALKCAPTATKAELKAAWRAALLETHADKQAGKTAAVQEAMEMRFQEVLNAYAVLRSDKKRLRYDQGGHNPSDDDDDDDESDDDSADGASDAGNEADSGNSGSEESEEGRGGGGGEQRSQPKRRRRAKLMDTQASISSLARALSASLLFSLPLSMPLSLPLRLCLCISAPHFFYTRSPAAHLRHTHTHLRHTRARALPLTHGVCLMLQSGTPAGARAAGVEPGKSGKRRSGPQRSPRPRHCGKKENIERKEKKKKKKNRGLV